MEIGSRQRGLERELKGTEHSAVIVLGQTCECEVLLREKVLRRCTTVSEYVKAFKEGSSDLVGRLGCSCQAK